MDILVVVHNRYPRHRRSDRRGRPEALHEGSVSFLSLKNITTNVTLGSNHGLHQLRHMRNSTSPQLRPGAATSANNHSFITSACSCHSQSVFCRKHNVER